ncbi:hypothetical protein R5R35_008129 [Gryllus longicercus]|uniref:Small ribosomal subunit protein mS23 n=1 Tax=Gryllus longicercus TaxID=2509291 RepID=A0AAN9VFW1_9ORTH
MANSRLERLGTIYSRVSGLLRAQAMKEEDKPLWFEIYKAFPPEREPKIDHPIPEGSIKPILYAEDIIRAKFHKGNKFIRMVNLSDSVRPSPTQQVISIFSRLKSERAGESEDQLYEEALDILNSQNVKMTETEPREQSQSSSLVDSFTAAKKKDSNINIKNILKES